MVHNVAAILLDGQRVSADIVQDGFLAEICLDHYRDERVDALVVGDAEVRGEDGLHPARGLRLDEAGNVVVNAAVFDALVDDVYATTGRLVDQVSVAVQLDLMPLGQDSVQLAGEEIVVQIVLIAGTGGEDGEGRVRRRGCRPQHLSEAPHQTIQRSHLEGGI